MIQESGGWCLDVTEAEIAIAKAEIGAEGLGCEPASAVTLAGLKKLRAQGAIQPSETVVLVLTGHTLKDADYTIDFHRGTLLTDEEKEGLEAEIDALRRDAITRGCDAGRGAGRAEGRSGMKRRANDRIGFRLRLPATSANLGPGFDAVAVALDFTLEIEAEPAPEFRLRPRGAMRSAAAGFEDNLILEIYKDLLDANGRPIVPLAIRMANGIPLGMGCGSSAAARLAAIALAVHFGELGWDTERILEEAYALEGHPDNVAACWLGGFVSAVCEGRSVHVARVDPPAEWRAIVALPAEPLATSKARAVLPASYSLEDVVANLQSVAVLGLAFAQARGDLLRLAMNDRIHQPYRAPICPLLPLLLPLGGQRRDSGCCVERSGPGGSGGCRRRKEPARRYNRNRKCDRKSHCGGADNLPVFAGWSQSSH